MVDWDRPIEAVNKETGKTFPLTLKIDHMKPLGFCGLFYWTNECPNPYNSNQAWEVDGTDACHYKLWYVRNITDLLPESSSVEGLGLF